MPEPDLSEFEALTLKTGHKPRCQVAKAAEQLEPGERDQLYAACAADKDKIGTGAIAKWLAKRGHKASPPAVLSHRNNTCTCRDE